MEFEQKIIELAERLDLDLEHLQTEEATKNALIMPFIQVLGYNVFDPREVVPEFTADIGTKKGEKVDYAIMRDASPIMIFECKSATADLSKTHASQLFRYFTATDVRIGVLTNGIEYRFYSDLDTANKMDEKPFLVLNMDNPKTDAVRELKRFAKPTFDVEQIVSAAADMKYTREIKRIINAQLTEPDEAFIRFFAGQVYSGRFTQSVKDQFGEIVQQALKQFINDRVNDRLRKAQSISETETEEVRAVPERPETENPEVENVDEEGHRQIVTTEEELEGFYIARAILREVVDVKRVTIRDTKSYCGILLDDNNRKPICRLHFNSSQKRLGLFDADKNEDRVAIDEVDDIYKYVDRLKATVLAYEGAES